MEFRRQGDDGHAPWFDQPDLFDQRRIRLADTDGSGTTDILYLGRDGVRVYLNFAGNALSEARTSGVSPAIDNVDRGGCRRSAGPRNRLPDLVVAVAARCGTAAALHRPDVRKEAASSFARRTTTWALRRGSNTRRRPNSILRTRRRARLGSPALPFPVHVVRRVETYDEVSRNRMVTRYTYHHGFYDGLEREFRGFGARRSSGHRGFRRSSANRRLSDGDNWAEASNVPPVLTSTWFHTGVFLEGGRMSRHLAHEYFQAPDGGTSLLPDTILPSGSYSVRGARGMPGVERFDAAPGGLRARREREGENALQRSSESNFTIVTVQPKGGQSLRRVLHSPARGRDLPLRARHAADPRIGHELTLAVDRFGNVLRSAAIGYQRRDPVFAEQGQTLATLTRPYYTNPVLDPDAYRVPSPAEVKTYQLTAPELNGADRVAFARVEALAASAVEIAYEKEPIEGETQKRLIERARSIYRKNDLSDLLPLGVAGESRVAGRILQARAHGRSPRSVRRQGVAGGAEENSSRARRWLSRRRRGRTLLGSFRPGVLFAPRDGR